MGGRRPGRAPDRTGRPVRGYAGAHLPHARGAGARALFAPLVALRPPPASEDLAAGDVGARQPRHRDTLRGFDPGNQWDPATPGAAAAGYPLDVFFLLPFWFAGVMPPFLVVVLVGGLFVAGFVIPYYYRERPGRWASDTRVSQSRRRQLHGLRVVLLRLPVQRDRDGRIALPGLDARSREPQDAGGRRRLAVCRVRHLHRCLPVRGVELPAFLEVDLQRQVAEAVRA